MINFKALGFWVVYYLKRLCGNIYGKINYFWNTCEDKTGIQITKSIRVGLKLKVSVDINNNHIFWILFLLLKGLGHK